MSAPPRVGVLALQGAFREHRRALERLGTDVREVRLPAHLDGLDAVVIPGGESTTMAKLMVAYDLDAALPAFVAGGGAVWGTCAGAILIARTIHARPDQPRLGLLDVTIARNDYGRQVASFEADVDVDGLDAPFRGVFIRAPRILEVGPDVHVLATHDGDPVAVASGRVLATVFHAELSGDDRLHAAFLQRIAGLALPPRPERTPS